MFSHMFNFSGVDITPMWIIAQVFAFFALCSMIYAMVFTKKKVHTQMAVMTFNALMSISVALQSNWIMIGIHGLAVVRDAVFIWQDKYHPNNRRLSISVILFFMTMSIIVGAITFGWWFDVFLITASMFVDYGSWAKGVHKIRISRFVFSSLAIVNFSLPRFFSPVGIIISSFAIASVLVFYARYFLKRRTSQPTALQQTLDKDAELG